MTSRPIFAVDRDAQILALWQGRPRDQRRLADVDPFCQWLADYAPWLVRGGAPSRERIQSLVESHTIADADLAPKDRRRARVPQRRGCRGPALPRPLPPLICTRRVR